MNDETPALVVGYSDHGVTLQFGTLDPIELTLAEVDEMTAMLTEAVEAGTDCVFAHPGMDPVALSPDAAAALVHALAQALDDLLTHQHLVAGVEEIYNEAPPEP